ncbi:DUF2975 domain-containing protein [Caproiciproducens sp. NJN-50]|uniref:DUF2975 domain-containing protein n=2 Tax=Acutalibacteraceae TaxID=3082771 RepID=UPI0013E8C988|nr:DUF2975 domain-containing protein [Caproiciproducens sp. NJN-50]
MELKQTELSKWLKGIIVFAGLIGAALCFWIVPALGKETARENPGLSGLFRPCLTFVWITAVPFYFALWKSWQICREIAKDNSFCRENGKRLRDIGALAVSESLLYFAAAVILLILKLLHPGVLLLILFIIFAGTAAAVVCAALSHLVEKACDLKQENDLTI